jgi:hypothetical protein
VPWTMMARTLRHCVVCTAAGDVEICIMLQNNSGPDDQLHAVM